MALRSVRFDALTAREVDAWHALRAANPALDSPSFHPGFARAVHATGQRVEVAVAQDHDGTVRALLPVHRDGATLRPVGWPGADFQGPIAAPGTDFPALDLLTGGVRGFAFDHLLTPCPGFDPWVEARRSSPFLDVTGGLTGYLGRASRSGRDNMGQARRRLAKARRELGEVRFVADSTDPAVLDRIVELKRAQYAATGARDYVAEPARRAMVGRLLGERGTSFAAVMSTVHAGPHLLAAHFGLRSDGVLHWWFPVYDPAFAHLAPGWMLLRELVDAAPRLGLTRIDLGRGDDEYKRRARTGETTVAQGLVTRNAVRRVLRRARDGAVSAARTSPLGPTLRQAVRTLRRPPAVPAAGRPEPDRGDQ